jgi:hypothetical protein
MLRCHQNLAARNGRADLDPIDEFSRVLGSAGHRPQHRGMTGRARQAYRLAAVRFSPGPGARRGFCSPSGDGRPSGPARGRQVVKGFVVDCWLASLCPRRFSRGFQAGHRHAIRGAAEVD